MPFSLSQCGESMYRPLSLPAYTVLWTKPLGLFVNLPAASGHSLHPIFIEFFFFFCLCTFVSDLVLMVLVQHCVKMWACGEGKDPEAGQRYKEKLKFNKGQGNLVVRSKKRVTHNKPMYKREIQIRSQWDGQYHKTQETGKKNTNNKKTTWKTLKRLTRKGTRKTQVIQEQYR